MIKIYEYYLNIQGEGYLMGTPTIFIRLAGCNLNCIFCDTKYSRKEQQAKMNMHVLDLVGAIYTMAQNKITHVCVTGGEPLVQREEALKLIHELCRSGFKVEVETNGSKRIDDLVRMQDVVVNLDCKCPGSGMHNKMKFGNFKLLRQRDQVKFIIGDNKDYEYAKDILNVYKQRGHVIFTPVGGIDLKWLVEKVIADKLNVQVLFQMHKLLYGNKRGV